MVGVVHERRVRLLQTAGELLLVHAELVPRQNPRIAGRQHRVGRNHAECLLPFEYALAVHVPAFVEAAAVLAPERFGRLMRRVRGTGREVQEEGSLGHDRVKVTDHADRLIDQVLGEVVSLFDASRGLDRTIVADQFRVELVGFAAEKAIEPFEALCERPVVKWAGRRALGAGRDVPFAGGERGIAHVAQHACHRRCPPRQAAAHVRESGVEVGDETHSDRVVIAARQQRGPSGRTHGGDGEVGEPQSVRGEPIEGRRLDGRAVAAKVGETRVVEQDDHHVWFRIVGDVGCGPPRHGLLRRTVDDPEKGIAHKRDRSLYNSATLPPSTRAAVSRERGPRNFSSGPRQSAG